MLPVLIKRGIKALELIADGFANRELSRDLLMCKTTVENHIHHLKIIYSARTIRVFARFSCSFSTQLQNTN